MADISPEQIAKIEEALTYDATIDEISAYSEVPRIEVLCYLSKQEKLKKYLDRKHLTTFMARKNVAGKVRDGDVDSAKWWLERKKKDEFSLKTENKIDLNADGKIQIQLLQFGPNDPLAKILNANPPQLDTGKTSDTGIV